MNNALQFSLEQKDEMIEQQKADMVRFANYDELEMQVEILKNKNEELQNFFDKVSAENRILSMKYSEVN